MLLDVTGSGAKKTQVFQAAADWDLSWEAKDTSGYGCYLGVMVYDAGSNGITGVAVNTQVQGSKSDVDHEHKSGRF